MNSLGKLIGLKRKSRTEMFIEWLFMMASATFGGGWVFMLAVGIAHDVWLHQLPTIGYWWAVLLVWMLRGLFSRFPKVEPYRDKP